MKIFKILMTGLSLTLISFVGLAQGSNEPKPLGSVTTDTIPINNATYIDFEAKRHLNNLLLKRKPIPGVLQQDLSLAVTNRNHINPALESALSLDPKEETFFSNKRNVYSSLWAFASLNYLYADLVGVMDKNKLVQYQNGEVEGVKITPKFLTVAGAFMQIPLANVFLPHLIKNDKALRWVQIASGAVMTVVQSGTLFVGKPTPYYALFSGVEISATTYITIDAIRWKPKSKKVKNP